METSTKILLLITIYGLPLCFAIMYRIKENTKMKRKVIKRKNLFTPVQINDRK